ncbi:hypothetical protein ABW19_dt0206580 [Dactylella cylindrospora]|nr:hypothetical protein ABW19_dt0206580 [Dactylella cylindrospora]
MSTSTSTTGSPLEDTNHIPPPTSKLLVFLDASVYYPIFINIINRLGFDDIVRLARTCQSLSTLPRQTINRECNIDNCLSHYFTDPKKTRAVMARQNAIIGSHFATGFFSREFSTSTIRFYVTQGEQAKALEEYILSDGYSEIPRSDPTVESRRRKFSRQTSQNFWMVIEIRLCSSSPVGAFLAAANTTHLLNLVTSHKAYCMFPVSSFMHKISFITRDLTNDSVQHTLARYSQSGYDFQPIIWHSSKLPYTDEITSPRRFGDRFTWVIEFDNTDIPPPSVPQFVVESTCFRLSVTPDPSVFLNRQQNYATSRYRLSCSAFKSCVLKHTYTFGCSAWRAYVGARVDALTRIELFKLPQRDRADANLTLKRDYYQLEGSFARSKGWKYFDHLIQDWWEEWVKENHPGVL